MNSDSSGRMSIGGLQMPFLQREIVAHVVTNLTARSAFVYPRFLINASRFFASAM